MAARAGDRRADRRLSRLFPKADVDHPAQPHERCSREQQRDRERPPLADVERADVRADQRGGGERHREEGRAERAERVAIARRSAEPEPERAARRTGNPRGEHRQGDPERQQPRDPQAVIASRMKAEMEKVGRVRDRLGGKERRRRAGSERDAVEDVVELAVGKQHQRARDREQERSARKHDAEPDDLMGARARRQHRPLARDVAGGEAEDDPGDEPPDDGEGDHRQRLVLVEIDVPEVEQEGHGHADCGGDERERVEAEQAEHDDGRQAGADPDPEGAHVRRSVGAGRASRRTAGGTSAPPARPRTRASHAGEATRGGRAARRSGRNAARPEPRSRSACT